MTLSMDTLVVGEEYDRPSLARLWGYASWTALGRGVFTPANDNKIIFFVTEEKQRSLTQYRDYFDGDTLYIDGESKRTSDRRLIGSRSSVDRIFLFFRRRHHRPFTYYGEVFLLNHAEGVGAAPSRFSFATDRNEVLAVSSIAVEQRTHGYSEVDPNPSTEGRPRVRQHLTYERSKKNRAQAIKIHGTTCKICGFDFDAVYGPEFARGYIEIHHVTPLAGYEGEVDPRTDLVPLCSNCHSMVHRRRDAVVSIEELRSLLVKHQRRSDTAFR